MSAIDTSGTMKYKDASGNIYVLYPITKRDNIDGLEYVDDHIADVDNPHETTADQVSAISRDGVVASSSDGVTYTATIDGVTSLVKGLSFIMVPSADSTTTSPTLNVNGLGARNLRRRVSSGSSTTTSGGTSSWLSANGPVLVTYDGRFWVTDLVTPNANDITGTVAIANGGTGVTSLDNLKTLVTPDTWLLTTGTDITSNTDLNSYTNIGNYRCTSSSISSSLSNNPYSTGKSFIMKVYSSVGTTSGTYQYRIQEIIPINPTSTPIARRYFSTSNSGSTWSFGSWVYDLNSNNWDEYVTLEGSSSSGMVRDFTTGLISTQSYATSNNNPKIYTVTVEVETAQSAFTYIVDYKTVQVFNQSSDKLYMSYVYIDQAGTACYCVLTCTFNSGNIIFSVTGDARIVQICGFY